MGHNPKTRSCYGRSDGTCPLSGVRVAASSHQSDVDGLDHGPGSVQPLRGHLQAVSGDPSLYDATSPAAGARQRRRHSRLQHPALSRTPARVLPGGIVYLFIYLFKNFRVHIIQNYTIRYSCDTAAHCYWPAYRGPLLFCCLASVVVCRCLSSSSVVVICRLSLFVTLHGYAYATLLTRGQHAMAGQ